MIKQNTINYIIDGIITFSKNMISKRWFLILLILILIWRILNQNFILLIIIGYLFFKAYQESKHSYIIYTVQQNQDDKIPEKFDANMLEFLPVGEQRYDLRGFPLFNRPLYDCWNTNYGDCYNSNF